MSRKRSNKYGWAIAAAALPWIAAGGAIAYSMNQVPVQRQMPTRVYRHPDPYMEAIRVRRQERRRDSKNRAAKAKEEMKGLAKKIKF